MAVFVAQRCLHHPLREAAARCPECGQFYCRECITEHDDRVVCSSCLRKLTAKTETRRRSFAPAVRVSVAVFSFLLAWMFFFLVGRMIVSVPTSFHEGTVWERDWFGTEEP